MVATQQEFLEWKNQEMTKLFFKALSNEREELKEGLVTGLYSDHISEVQGRCAAVQQIINANFEDMMEGLRGE